MLKFFFPSCLVGADRNVTTRLLYIVGMWLISLYCLTTVLLHTDLYVAYLQVFS